MDNAFLKPNQDFTPWSLEHILVLLFLLIFGIGFIWFSKKYLTRTQQVYTISFFTILVAWTQISKVYILLSIDDFDMTTDLPFELCNMMPFVLPFALFLQNERFWAVLYFFIMAGTAQALVTPTHVEALPHFEGIRYWVVHGGLVIAVLYPIFTWGYKVVFKDIFVGWWSLNVLAFLIMAISIPLGANYMYMLGHPPGKTMYNLMGDFPYYIISLQFASLALFGLLYLPFRKKSK